MRPLHLVIIVGTCSLLWAAGATGVAAQPPSPPHAFFGAVTIDGQPAPAGTVIESRAEGVLTGIPGNPITTTELGRYGGPMVQEQKLIVQGQVADGVVLVFYVNGSPARCAAPGGDWQDSYPFQSGGVTPLSLNTGRAPANQPSASPTETPDAAPPGTGAGSSPTATPRSPRAGPEAPAATATPARPEPRVQASAAPTIRQDPTVEPPSGSGASVPAVSPAPARPSVTAGSPARTAEPVAVNDPATPLGDAQIAGGTPAAAVQVAAVVRPTSTPLLQAGRVTSAYGDACGIIIRVARGRPPPTHPGSGLVPRRSDCARRVSRAATSAGRVTPEPSCCPATARSSSASSRLDRRGLHPGGCSPRAGRSAPWQRVAAGL